MPLPVRYIAAPHRGPECNARNTGIEQSVAPVILFMDDDCVRPTKRSLPLMLPRRPCPGTVTIGRAVWHPGLTVTSVYGLW